MSKTIRIEPIYNGWLIEDYDITNNNKTTKIAIHDREKLVKYLTELIPPSGSEQEFIDNIDKEKK